MKTVKAVQKIPPIYRLIALLLFLTGVLVFCKGEPYLKVFDEDQKSYEMTFLQEGQYLFEITYVGFQPGDRIWIYSDYLTDEQNHIGVTLSETVVPEYAGIVALPVTLSEGVYHICVVNDSEVGYFAQGQVQSVRLQNWDHYYVAGILFLISVCILFAGYRHLFEKYPIQWLLVGMGVLVSIPLFSDFLYQGDDTTFHLARLEGIYQSLRAGEFPVRINVVQNEGYGDISASMYPSFFLFPFVALRYFRVSLMLCFKTLLMAINIATALVSYYSFRKLFHSHKMALWGCILYTFSAYRLINVYLRCAVGEALAMVFLPLLLWGTCEVLWGDRKKWYVLALGMTCMLQSHVLSTEICAFFMLAELVIWLICSPGKELPGRILQGLKAIGLTILLNAGFLVPFVFYSTQDLQCFHMANTVGIYPSYYSQMFTMFMSAVSDSIHPGSTKGEMPLSVGFVLLAGAVLFCVNQAGRGECGSKEGKLGRRCLGYGILGLILSSWLFPWNRLLENEWFEQITSPLQFPWRFLGIASLFLCVVTAVAIETTPEKTRKYVKIIAMVLVICGTGYYFDMLCQQRDTLSDKMEIEGINHSDSMYMYYISDQFEPWHLTLSRKEAAVGCSNMTNVTVSDYVKRGTKISVTTSNPTNAQEVLVFPQCYYPGYVVRVDGEPVETKIWEVPVRMIACDLPEQTAHITVEYEGLWFFRAGDAVTVLTAAGLAVAVLWKRKKAKAYT